jgi:SNF2 family DNA or RNA helicase
MKYKREPWGHQLKAIEIAKELPEYGLFFEVGAGKSLTAVNILRHKYFHHSRVLKTLIFGPPIVLENWKREWIINSEISPKKIHVLSGSHKDRLKIFLKHKDEDGCIFITNYEALLMKELHTALLAWKPEVIIWDELHKLKDPTSKRTKLAIPLADVSLYRLGLTGTPILNSLMDMFSQFRVLDLGRTFGKNFFVFRNRFFYDKNAGMPAGRHFPDWRPRPKIESEFNNMISQVSMTVKKEDCMTLPPLVKSTLFTKMSSEQERSYQQMKKDLISYIGDKAAVANLAITKALRLQQIVSGFVKLDDGSVHRFKNNPRADQLHGLLEELTPKHKVIIWAVFHENYVTIREVCERLKIKYVEVTGAVTDKQGAVDSFNNDPTTRVFVSHPLSGGIGINLVVADISIFYSRNFSLEQDIQAEGRFNRGGSEIHKKLLRYDLVTENTIDEQVLQALHNKQNLSDSVLLNLITKESNERI